MSSDTYRKQLERLQKDKAKLEQDLAKERSSLAQLQKQASDLQSSIMKTKSVSARRSKQRQWQSKQEQIAKTQKKIGEIEKKIAEKNTAINQKTGQLTSAEASEVKKRQQAERQHLEDVNAEIEQQMLLENARQAIRPTAYQRGEPLRLSGDAKVAARRLLEMLEQKELEKESRLVALPTSDRTDIRLVQPSGQLAEFSIPIADIKELAAYGVLSLQETRSKGRTSGWNMLLLPERLKEVVTERSIPNVFRIFYSWQSWTPGSVNRHFVLTAVEQAAKAIRDDESIEVEPVVDRDTVGEAGSVDIANTIFRKIRESQIFICDVTIVTEPGSPHPIPNPNVMIELGYAAAILGWERIICVVNTAYGGVEAMPFDLRNRRLLTYHLLPDTDSKAATRKQLTKHVKGAVEVIVEQFQPEIAMDGESNADEPDEIAPRQ